MTPTYEEAVSSWAGHLRAGGTTPWSAYAPTHATPLDPLPGAAALELVRRLNAAAGPVPPGLADLVLSTPAPGRGLVDVPLPWAASRPFGTRPVEPEHAPVEELVRSATGVLVRLLPGVPLPRPDPGPARWPLPWRPRFRLYGAPLTVAGIRRGLRTQGLVESDWRPVHLVVARPVDVMMAEHWAAHAASGGTVRWPTLWRRSERSGALPRRLEVTATAARLAARPVRRPERVHLVAGRSADEAAALVAGLLRARPFALEGADVLTDAAATDLLRRVNRVASVGHDRDGARRVAAALDGILAGLDPAGDPSPRPPGVPTRAQRWAHTWAARTAQEADRGPLVDGYSVHGDPGVLAPAAPPDPHPLDPARTLDVALAACLAAWTKRERSGA